MEVKENVIELEAMMESLESEKSESLITPVIENELVMEHLSRHLSIKELGNCRLLSRTWNAAITPIFRKTAVVKRIEPYLQWRDENPTSDDSNPFRRFAIEFICEIPKETNGDKLIVKLLKTCAPDMTYLRLSGPGFYTPGEKTPMVKPLDEKDEELSFHQLKSLIFNGAAAPCHQTTWILRKIVGEGLEGTTAAPNLECLDLANAWFSDKQERYGDETGKFLKQLFARSPELKILRFRCFGDIMKANISFRELEPELRAFANTRKGNPKKLEIKVLDILAKNPEAEENMPSSFPAALKTARFPLETLAIDVGRKTKAASLSSLLEQFKDTLKKLVLYRGTSERPPKAFEGFPFGIEFGSLCIFRLTDRIAPNLNFLKFMPKLQLLEICSGLDKQCFWSGSFTPMREISHESWGSTIINTDEELLKNLKMEDLKEFRYDFEIPTCDVHLVAQMMPNVERLTIPVLCDPENEAEFLEEVFEQWGKVTHLILRMKREQENLQFNVSGLRKLKDLEKLTVLPIEYESEDGDYFDRMLGFNDEDEDENYDSEADEEDEVDEEEDEVDEDEDELNEEEEEVDDEEDEWTDIDEEEESAAGNIGECKTH